MNILLSIVKSAQKQKKVYSKDMWYSRRSQVDNEDEELMSSKWMRGDYSTYGKMNDIDVLTRKRCVKTVLFYQEKLI